MNTLHTTIEKQGVAFQIGVALTLILLASLTRLVPHLPNATSVAAVALFAGAYLPKRWGWLLALIAMLATDALIGWDKRPIMLSVYASLLGTTALGSLLRHRRTVPSVLGLSLTGSLLFFLVTNAAVWAWSGMYVLTADGLVMSYVNALPFFRNTVTGDLVSVTLLFGAYEAIQALVVRPILTKQVR